MNIKMVLSAVGVLSGLGAGVAHAQVMTVSASDKPYCREFQQTLTIAGKTQKGYGTACLQADGSWEIEKPAAVANTVTTVATQPSIQYVVQKERVYVVPPEPFIIGTVLIGGHPRHFDEGFRPRWRPDMHNNWRGHDQDFAPSRGWRH